VNLEALLKENQEQKEQIAQLKFRIAQLEKFIYGFKSERFKPQEIPTEQGNLFVDSVEQQPVVEITEKITYERKKGSSHKGRNELPAHLPVREVIIEPEEDTTNMTKIGEEITETLEYQPASLIKVITIRPKYAKPQGEGIVIAPLPSRPFDKSIAEASLLSHIIVSKFVDHLPFYRLIEIFKREFRWDPSKSTVNDWFIAVCTLLKPLYEFMIERLLESYYLQADESPMQVQDRNKNGSTHRGQQWVYHSPKEGIVIFHYYRNRSAQAPKEFLANYKGWVQCDGHKAYDKLEKQLPGIKLVGCWVHARRKYFEAKDNDKDRSEYALQIFSEIYKYEAVCKDYTPADRKEYREKNVKPQFEKLKSWIESEPEKVLPKSKIGQAMTYTLNQWPKLIRCLEDGQLQLDNNLIENKIRPLALGRKNYLFAGSHQAAQRIAMMYSFFATCKIHDVNPREWLTSTLEKIKDTKMSELDQLMPQNFKGV
jgi:transposase